MTDGGAPQEIEVKIPTADLARVRELLRERGGAPDRPRHAESNVLFDDASGRLAASGCALRLRLAEGKAILTFKGPARFASGIKTREERETAVGDGREAEAILAGLGFSPRFRYEKFREEWTLPGCAVALDETPIGSFVEIEGDPPAIRRAVAALELDFAAALPYSYAGLYARRRKEDPSLPPDMVFPAANE